MKKHNSLDEITDKQRMAIDFLRSSGVEKSAKEISVITGSLPKSCNEFLFDLARMGVIKIKKGIGHKNKPINLYEYDFSKDKRGDNVAEFYKWARSDAAKESWAYQFAVGGAVNTDSAKLTAKSIRPAPLCLVGDISCDDMSDPYAEGWDAFDSGLAEDSCKYSGKSDNRRLWLAGYRAREVAVKSEELRGVRARKMIT